MPRVLIGMRGICLLSSYAAVGKLNYLTMNLAVTVRVALPQVTLTFAV